MFPSVRAVSAAVVATVTLAACGGGPGTEQDLVNALTRDDGFTTTEAECIAGAVFDTYGSDEEALEKISGASSFEALGGPEGVEGFNDFFTRTVGICTNSG